MNSALRQVVSYVFLCQLDLLLCCVMIYVSYLVVTLRLIFHNECTFIKLCERLFEEDICFVRYDEQYVVT